MNPKFFFLTEDEKHNVINLGTAGYITDNGEIIYMQEYHGEDKNLRDKGYIEFSNTHPEEDTCIRLYKKPTDEQYKLIEKIIDLYLNNEGYCKIEIWKDKQYSYYQVFSLYEDACKDFNWEEKVGNWTGYKLVQIIKNRFNGLNEEYLVEVRRASLLSTSKQGDSYKGQDKNRWDAKSDCKIANTVSDYNKIDMNTFWKDDVLKFGVKVQGKTGTYLVTIAFSGVLPKIQRYIKDAKYKFERDTVTKALMDAIDSSDVTVDCTCSDFKYRLAYYATQKGFKAGPDENRPAEITNPNDNKGACCKHILAALNNASWIRNVASVIVNYANYCKDKMEYNYGRFIFPKIFGIPYEKAVQMCIDDFDNEGNPIDELHTDENTINLANFIAKARFKGNKSKQQIEKEKQEEENKAKEQNTEENAEENKK